MHSLSFHPQVIFFDLVGTLIVGREDIGRQYAEVASRVGLKADEDSLGRAFRAAMRRAPPMAFPSKTLAETVALERQWWRDLVHEVLNAAQVDRVLEDEKLFDNYFEVLFDHFTTADAWVVYDDVKPTLAQLSAAGIEVGLVTNYDTRVYPVLDALGLSSLLDSVTIPADVGFAKPDPAIFQHALSRHGLVEAGEALYVGDSWEDDYVGAGEAGLVPVLLDRAGRYTGKADVRRVETLGELL